MHTTSGGKLERVAGNCQQIDAAKVCASTTSKWFREYGWSGFERVVEYWLHFSHAPGKVLRRTLLQ